MTTDLVIRVHMPPGQQPALQIPPVPPPQRREQHAQLDDMLLPQDWSPPEPEDALRQLANKYSAQDKAEAWSETVAATQSDHTKRIKRWNSELEYFLVYSSILSAVITTFAAQTYQLLKPVSDRDATVLLQAILGTQLQHSIRSSGIPGQSILATTGTQALTPSRVVVVLNILLFSSLIFSVAATTFGIFIKQWLHELHSPKSGSAKYIARRNLYLFQSMDVWRIESIIGWLFVLLQVSAALLFAAILALLWNYHPLVAMVASVLVGCVYVLAITSIILPIIYSHCCYSTPLTYPLYQLTQIVANFYHRIRKPAYGLIRKSRLALIKPKLDEEGLSEQWKKKRKDILERYPTTIKAIVTWDERERLAISRESDNIDGRLVEATALRYISADKIMADDVRSNPITYLTLREDLTPESFLLSLTRIFESINQAFQELGYDSSTIPVDFWIASLFKIMPVGRATDTLSQETPSYHADLEKEQKLAIFRTLKYIETAYSVASLCTPGRRKRLLQALSLVAHHSPTQYAKARALAHRLLIKYLSSDEFVRGSPWSLARNGIVILYKQLTYIKVGSKRDEERWKDATSLVSVLVRCCLLSNQWWKEEAKTTDLESLQTSGHRILRWFADEFLGQDILEREDVVPVGPEWVVRKSREKLASFIQAVGVCLTSILKVLTELPELNEGALKHTMVQIEEWHTYAGREKTSQGLELNPADVLVQVQRHLDILKGKLAASNARVSR